MKILDSCKYITVTLEHPVKSFANLPLLLLAEDRHNSKYFFALAFFSQRGQVVFKLFNESNDLVEICGVRGYILGS